jgi:hypothetical protein
MAAIESTRRPERRPEKEPRKETNLHRKPWGRRRK